LDNLRSDRARAQQGDHIGKRFHVPGRSIMNYGRPIMDRMSCVR
jgi:hypothetical protein